MRSFTRLLLLALLLTNVRAYDYPAGIPTAWIAPDIDRPSPPSPWNSETPGFYFVDEAIGVDSSREFGTPLAPRKSIPAELPAGSYVEIRGTYSRAAGGYTTINAKGTRDAWVAAQQGPVWLVGNKQSPGSFSNQVIFEGSALCVDGLNNRAGGQKWLINSTNPAAQRSATHMLIRNCELDGRHNTNTTALTINGSTFSTSRDVIIYNNRIHRFGPTTVDTDRDYVGVFVHNYTENIWVLDNQIHDMAGSGIGISTRTSTPSYTNNIYCARNEISRTWAVGISVKTSNRVVLAENLIHDIVYTSWSNAKGIGLQYAALETWIIGNTIFNCDFGIRLGSTNPEHESIYIIDNLVYNIQPITGHSYPQGAYGPAAIALWGGDDRFVVGNRIFNARNGISMPSAKLPPYGAVIERNVISSSTGFDILIEQSFHNAIIAHNTFHSADSEAHIRLGNSIHTLETLASVGIDNTNKATSTAFFDPLQGDFRLTTPTEPLLSENLTQDLYTAFQASVGTSLPLVRHPYTSQAQPAQPPLAPSHLDIQID